MGWNENTKASIGIKILLSDLIKQIKKNNSQLIINMFYNGIIEDDNENFNDIFQNIVYIKNNSIKNNYNLLQTLINQIKDNCLDNKYLLVPIKNILVCERWGYGRTGTNSISRPIDFDLSIDLEKYKKLNNYEIVFILEQNSG